MTAIQTEVQSLSPDDHVSLFVLDATFVGGTTMHFVQGSEHDGPVTFGEIPYVALDVEFTGLETSGVGALPTPTIKVGNSDGVFQAMLNTFGGLEGSTVHRIRTYRKFLDGGSEADPQAYFGPDTFRIERKVIENNSNIEWELSAAIDQEGKQIPGRQVVRDTCLWRYRIYNGSAGGFDYSKAQCPYTGAQSYDINDAPVALAANDVPSRRLSCCRTRFGRANPLPFGGFPGVARSNS